MTIGTNDILNNSSELTAKDKSAKKTEYTTDDYSTISNQFANIFSTQFTAHFQNQFDYSAANKQPNFMANTATSMTDNKYYSPSPSTSNVSTNPNVSQTNVSQTSTQDAPRQEFKAQTTEQTTTSSAVTAPANNTSVDSSAKAQQQTEQAKPTETAKNTENKSQQETTQKADAKSQQGQETEQAKVSEKDSAIKQTVAAVASDATKTIKKAEKEEKTSDKAVVQNEASVKVAIKDDQIKEATTLVGKISETTAAVSEVKDAKIEKLEVKTTKKASSTEESKKEVKAEAKTEEKADAKAEVAPKTTDDIQNKVSLERITANVVEAAPAETNQLDKILKKDTSKNAAQTKEQPDNKNQVEFKNPAAFANNQNFEQNFSQNQNSQNPLKDNILKGLLPLDTSLLKNNIQGNMQFNNVMHNAQPATMMEKNIAEQVLNQIKGNISTTGKSEVSMVLNPERLGKVTLNIMNEKGVMSAEIKTETKEAAEALNKSINELKETLKQQGVVCTNLVVKVEEPQKSENQTNFAQQEHSPKGFEQGTAQNSNEGSFQNSTHENTTTANAEYKQNIQEEQEQPAQEKAEDNGLVDYRV